MKKIDQNKIEELAELILNGMKDSELADELAAWLNQIPELERKRGFLRSFEDFIYKPRDNEEGEEIEEKLPNGLVLTARVNKYGTLRLRYGAFSTTKKFIQDRLTELRDEISRHGIKNRVKKKHQPRQTFDNEVKQTLEQKGEMNKPIREYVIETAEEFIENDDRELSELFHDTGMPIADLWKRVIRFIGFLDENKEKDKSNVRYWIKKAYKDGRFNSL